MLQQGKLMALNERLSAALSIMAVLKPSGAEADVSGYWLMLSFTGNAHCP